MTSQGASANDRVPESTSSPPRSSDQRASGRRPRVAIVYRAVFQYRLPFYERLRTVLDERGIDLQLVYGQPSRRDGEKHDTVEVPWGRFISSTILNLAGREVYWQPVLGALRGADLVIVEQASKLLVNYVLLLQQALRLRRVAFWGHGKNFQASSATALAEAIKRLVSTRVHWWFAYNRTSADVVASLGFPRERITEVLNAVDTKAVISAAEAIDEACLARTRDELGLEGRHVGVFVGGMYPEKRLELLIEACHRIRREVPSFEMLFIGAGVDQKLVERAAASTPWMHYLGPRFGTDMVRFASLAHVMLMPGLVGLVVLDAFALGVPLITTAVPDHSPEIEYLENGMNGVMIPNVGDPDAYAAAVVDVLLDRSRWTSLRDGCLRSRGRYSIDAMALRFADGVERALATP